MNSLNNLFRPIISLLDCTNDAERQCCNTFIAIAARKAEAMQRVLDRKLVDE